MQHLYRQLLRFYDFTHAKVKVGLSRIQFYAIYIGPFFFFLERLYCMKTCKIATLSRNNIIPCLTRSESSLTAGMVIPSPRYIKNIIYFCRNPTRSREGSGTRFAGLNLVESLPLSTINYFKLSASRALRRIHYLLSAISASLARHLHFAYSQSFF